MKRSSTLLVLTLLAGLASCGTDSLAVEVPDDATFCSVFEGEYGAALAAAVPITDDGFAESVGQIVAWAQVLVDLAPGEIREHAQANLEYHKAQAAIRSASEFIPGSSAMHEWGNSQC
jgi:hypothetical protein